MKMSQQPPAFVTRLSVIMLWAWLILPLTALGGVSEGTAWLATQPNTSGSFGATAASLATEIQSTAEVLRAFQTLGQTSQPAYAPALNFLNTDTEVNTEFLARKIIVNAQAGNNISALINELITHQNLDGGFGDKPGYDSSVFDTTFALEALAAANYSSNQFVVAAVGYLLNHQNANGGWAESDNDTSVTLTALTHRALGFYRVTYPGVSTALANSQNYLLAQRNASGLWTEDFETALVIIALAPQITGRTLIDNSIAALQATQLANGSWDNDTYTTALALRALYLASQPQPDPTQGAVVGRVLDNTTGLPLTGVTVTATAATSQSTQTDADGRYMIGNVAPGPINLNTSLAGYLTVTAAGTVPSGQSLDFSPRLSKDPQPVPITVRGLVLRKDTGAPLTGVTISVLNTTFTTQTTANGRFEINGVPAGSIQVAIQLSGFLSAAYVVSAPSGGLMDLGSVALDSGTTSATTGSVQGTVVDALTSQPLRNVAVSLSGADNRTALTDINGQFAMATVNPGSVNTTATLDGYQTTAGSGTVAAGGTLVFNARLVKLTNPALTTITGITVDAVTRVPLPGVTVQIANTAFNAVTAADGSFQIGDVPRGPMTVTLSLTGYTPLAYTVSAPNGGLVMLGTVALAANVPITGNHNPIITSHAPTLAVAGQSYIYNVQASDPDGDALRYGLATYPNGMTIDSTSGQIKWTPTLTQAGPRTFTVVVFDTQGGSAQEVVNLNVSTGGSRSYVITDVQTLSGLYVNAVVPNNYVLGAYFSGGSGGVVGAPACPPSFFSGGSNVVGALSSLERLTGPNSLAGGSSSGDDIIMDMGQAYSSVSVFPQIDHYPFPNEGIEYTVWGSSDPNAVFPDGWRLATLVSIYRQGFVQTPSCAGQDETDDYTGLYTFGLNSYRYVRVRADYSITIFDTPDHTTWSGTYDDSGEPGWQSSEDEVDAVGGMVCDVKPTANAGSDIVGLTGQLIHFDGSASQGNILTYGWDINGDGVIDLTGPTPSYVFTGEVDRDVTLMVVDDRGCVGTGTAHVAIGLNLPRPDLTVNQVDASKVITDLQTLRVTGSAYVVIQNIGRVAAPNPALVTVFEDTNHNGVFDEATDNVLGSLTMPSGLARGASLSMDIPINGTVSFRDTTIYVMVDRNRQIDEEREDNNVGQSTGVCVTASPTGTLNPALKWAWTGSSVLPNYRQVMSIPIVAPLEDTNGDAKIDQQDVPGVVFMTFAGGNYQSDGVLRAVSGKDGRELWTVTDSAYRTTPEGSIAVADIDGDGVVEIIAPKSNGGLIAFSHNGAFKWQTSTPTRAQMIAPSPAIADMDGDGRPEIIVGNAVYNANGTLRWQANGFIGTNSSSPISITADLDLDGRQEVIAGAAAYAPTGERLWQNDAVGDGFVAVGNFNLDPYPEIVVVSVGRVFLLNHAGSVIWGPVLLPGGGLGGPPTIGDVDNDGIPEIGIAGSNRYVVFKANGIVLWSSTIQDNSSQVTGSSVFDFDGDGQVEVVYADELYLRVYRGRDGTVLFQVPNSSATLFELPVIVDIDNDNHADIVVCTNDYAWGSNGAGIRVYSDANNSWVNTRKIWNQHAYHITNINDDGTVPKVEANSWQVHNTYRLNIFPDRPRAVIVDLTASLLRLMDLGSGQLRLSVRVGNGGTTASPISTAAFYDGDPNQNGVLLGSKIVNALPPGQYQDVTLDGAVHLSGQNNVYAVVDPDNLISECRKDNNSVSAPATIQSLNGSIIVATDAAIYGPQMPVNIAATVVNTSALPATFNTVIRVEDNSGVVLATFPIRSLGTLNGGESTAVNEAWNTSSYLAGSYRARAQLLSVDGGALLNEALTSFSIRSEATGTASAVSLRVTTDRPVYNTIDRVQIQNLVTNVSANTLITGAALRVTVFDPLNQAIFTQDRPLLDLAPGALRDLLTPLSLNGAEVAVYRVVGAIVNGATQNVLATSQTSFEVRFDLSKSLTGKVAVAHAQREIGQTQSCVDTITNGGSLIVSNLELHRGLANLDTQLLISDTVTAVNLATGESQSLARSFGTGGLMTGHYACLLQAKIGGALKTLAFAPFVLAQPPIRVGAELRLGTRGRLLVLLDGAHHHDEEEDKDDKDDHDQGHDDDDSNVASDRDPFGPDNAPGLTAQRAFLEKLLKQVGWSYTITDTAVAFTRELRTGGYSVYALLSEQEKLAEQVQKELREAVFRGEGLLEAGSHDQRQGRIDEALGIKYIGQFTNAVMVEMIPSPLHPGGQEAFLFDDKELRAERQGSQTAGRFLGGSANRRDAVTFYEYGAGKSVYAGFDLLAQATAAGEQSMFAALILNSLTYTHPAKLVPTSGAVIPVNIVLTNRGVTAQVKAQLTLPTGATLIDAGTAQVASGVLTWELAMVAGEIKTLTFWLRPTPNGPSTLAAKVLAGVNSQSLQLMAEPNLTLTVNDPESLTNVLSRIDVLLNNHNPNSQVLKQARKFIEKTLGNLHPALAIDDLLKSTDALLGITDPDVMSIRVAVGLWIRWASGYGY